MRVRIIKGHRLASSGGAGPRGQGRCGVTSRCEERHDFVEDQRSFERYPASILSLSCLINLSGHRNSIENKGQISIAQAKKPVPAVEEI
jgi:hypothetical protein